MGVRVAIDTTVDRAADLAIEAASQGATVTISGVGDDPERTFCPWGRRGTADCAVFAPASYSGRRCGVPA